MNSVGFNVGSDSDSWYDIKDDNAVNVYLLYSLYVTHTKIYIQTLIGAPLSNLSQTNCKHGKMSYFMAYSFQFYRFLFHFLPSNPSEMIKHLSHLFDPIAMIRS